MDREYPQDRLAWDRPGPPVDAPLEVRQGPSTEVPNPGDIQATGGRFPMSSHKLSMAPAPLKVMFDLDESALKRAGLSSKKSLGIESALKGQGGELLEGTERLPVRAILKRRNGQHR